jgi:hypothetical protein
MHVFDIKQGFDSGYSNTPFLYSDIFIVNTDHRFLSILVSVFHISSSLLSCCQTLNSCYPIVWFITL